MVKATSGRSGRPSPTHDCEAADNWLAEIAAAFDRHPEVGVVAGSLVKPPAGPGRFKTCPGMIPLEVIYDPVATGYESPEGFGAAGANLAVRRCGCCATTPWAMERSPVNSP